MLLALIVYVYLNWPGVREAFVKAEMDRLTPEQSCLRSARRGQLPRPGRPTPGM